MTTNSSFHVYWQRRQTKYRAAVLSAPDEQAPKKLKHVEVFPNGKGWADLPPKLMKGIVGLDRLPELAGGEYVSGNADVVFVPGADEIVPPREKKEKAPKTLADRLNSVRDMGLAIAERPEFKEGSKQALAFALLRPNMTTHEWVKAMSEDAKLVKFNAIAFVKQNLALGHVRRKA